MVISGFQYFLGFRHHGCVAVVHFLFSIISIKGDFMALLLDEAVFLLIVGLKEFGSLGFSVVKSVECALGEEIEEGD